MSACAKSRAAPMSVAAVVAGKPVLISEIDEREVDHLPLVQLRREHPRGVGRPQCLGSRRRHAHDVGQSRVRVVADAVGRERGELSRADEELAQKKKANKGGGQ